MFLFVTLPTNLLLANPPVASYIFPAGGQRGTTVKVRVGGLYFHQQCNFAMNGQGVAASPTLKSAKTLWFEGPLLGLPGSQRKQDYPKDMAGEIRIDADAALGVRYWHASTSQGVTQTKKFIVGHLAEVVEEEIDGEPFPVKVSLPVTINGRIFPSEDVDVWSFHARKGESITCELHAARLGSPLDARIEVQDGQGRPITENDDGRLANPLVRFVAPNDGEYRVRVHDIGFSGGQAYVYRLTVTAGAFVEQVYPLGGRQGSEVTLQLRGQHVPATTSLTLPKQTGETFLPIRIEGKPTNSVLLDVGEVPETLEVEPNDENAGPMVDLPICLNGRIDKPGDSDAWRFTATKGEKYALELRARRLGSPLLAGVTVVDATGKVVLQSKQVGTDPNLTFAVRADGIYTVRVASLFRKEGSDAHAYRLYVRSEQPDFRVRLERDALTLSRGTEAKLKVFVDRVGGFAEAVTLRIDGLPKGVTATGKIAAKKPNGVLTLKAEDDVALGVSSLKIVGVAERDGAPLERIATYPMNPGEPRVDRLRLGVAIPTPFKFVGVYTIKLVPRGTVYHRRYRIERNGYTGPLTAKLADGQIRHLQGATGSPMTLAKDVTEFDYPVYLPPWMELGRTSRVQVMLVGVVRDSDGSEHVVSYTSGAQNDQIITILEPARASIEAERASLRVVPGKTLSLPIRLRRADTLESEAKVEMVFPAHAKGIAIEPVVIPADEEKGTLTIRFAETMPKGFPLTAVLRATLQEKGEPVVAESRVMFTGGS